MLSLGDFKRDSSYNWSRLYQAIELWNLWGEQKTFLDKIISLIILVFLAKKTSSIDLSRANEKKIIFVITPHCQIIMADGFRVLIFLLQ